MNFNVFFLDVIVHILEFISNATMGGSVHVEGDLRFISRRFSSDCSKHEGVLNEDATNGLLIQLVVLGDEIFTTVNIKHYFHKVSYQFWIMLRLWVNKFSNGKK